MANNDNRNSLQTFTRGSEIWMHQFRLLLVALRNLLVISSIAFLVLSFVLLYKNLSAGDFYVMKQYVISFLRDILEMKATNMEINVNDTDMQLPVEQVLSITEPLASVVLDRATVLVSKAFVIGLIVGVGISLVWWVHGHRQMKERQLRGASIVDGNGLKRLLKSSGEASPYEIAGVPMRAKSENLNTIFVGAQGTGKSTEFNSMLRQIRKRGKKTIVYDPTGEFTAAFYREGKDILLNPFDERMPNWNVWGEIEKDYHFDNIANGLIPEPVEADPFWAKAGRMVLKDVYRVLGRENQRTNAALHRAISNSNLEELAALLADTAGASFVDPKTERTGMSLKMTVQNQLDAFRYLPDDGPQFSIRQWVLNDNEEDDSWLFITAKESVRQAMAPILSLWIDIAIRAVLDTTPVHKERFWFALDELPTLQKLDILKLAVTNARKYGLCLLVGLQDFSQLKEIYGNDVASTIISGCQTKLILRVTDGDAARALANNLGETDVEEKGETISYGLAAIRDGVSIQARRQLRQIVLSSEIFNLKDMNGYLVIPGGYPIAKVEYKYSPVPKIAESFIERKGLSVVFDQVDNQQDDIFGDIGTQSAQLTSERFVRDEAGNLIDSSTGEIIEKAPAKATPAAAVEETGAGSSNVTLPVVPDTLPASDDVSPDGSVNDAQPEGKKSLGDLL